MHDTNVKKKWLVTSWETDVGSPAGERLFRPTAFPASYPRISWRSLYRGKEHESPAHLVAFFQCHAVGHISTSPYRYICIVFSVWTLWKCCLNPDLFLDIDNIRLHNSRTNLFKTSTHPYPLHSHLPAFIVFFLAGYGDNIM